MRETVFEVTGLVKAYSRGEERIAVLNGLSLSMAARESLAIVGSSGVGKSTLLHCLGLIDAFDAGEIRFGETLITANRKASREIVEERRRRIGFVFQFHYLMAELSALENVSIPLRLQGLHAKEALERSHEALDRVKLTHRLSHKPHELSGGEQQRVAIARALVHHPLLILADEPTGNLDPETALRVFEILAEECERQKSILIMATHNQELSHRLKKRAHLVKGILQ